MNLDIMSLMAASAAVAESTATSGLQSDPQQSGADGKPLEAKFTDILQGFIDNTSIDSEVNSLAEPLPGQARAQHVAAGASGDEHLVLAEPGKDQVNALPALTGEMLPLTGNDLPVAAALSNASGAAGASTTLPTTSANGAPTMANAQPPALAAAADPRPSASSEPMSNASSGIQRSAATGWFSQSGADQASAAPLIRDQARSASTVTPTATPNNAVTTDADSQRPIAVTAQTLAAARAVVHQAGRDEGRAPAAIPTTNLSAAFTDALLAVEGARPPVLPATAGAVGVTPAQTMAPLSTAVPTLNMAQAGWDQALGQRLVFMARSGLENAELRLDPPQLGSVNVKLALQGDHAQLILQAANPATRDVLEGALPRLKEMFGAEGLQLGSAHVADRDTGGRDRSTSGSEGWWAAEPGDGTGAETNEQIVTVDRLTPPPGRIYEKV